MTTKTREPTRYPKKCDQCGSDYMAWYKDQQFCSGACRGVAQRKPIEHDICDRCGVTYPVVHKGQRFCSKSCAMRARPRKRLPNRTCPQCGRSYRPKTRTQKNCSWHCRAEARRKAPLVKVCEQCGEDYEVPRHQAFRRFCGQRCAGLASREPAVPKMCPQCGEPFTHGPKRQFLCSRACADLWRRRPRGHRNCRRCGKRFPVTARYPNKQYCDWECFAVRANPKKTLPYRRLMEERLGRALDSSEVVHHINGNNKDHRIENLQVFPTNQAHMAVHRQQRQKTGEVTRW